MTNQWIHSLGSVSNRFLTVIVSRWSFLFRFVLIRLQIDKCTSKQTRRSAALSRLPSHPVLFELQWFGRLLVPNGYKPWSGSALRCQKAEGNSGHSCWVLAIKTDTIYLLSKWTDCCRFNCRQRFLLCFERLYKKQRKAFPEFANQNGPNKHSLFAHWQFVQ